MSLPGGWIRVPLSEVCSKIVDGSHNPPRATDSGFPMLSARNIQGRQIHFDNFRYISDEDFSKEHGRTNVKVGDVLLTIVGTIGRTAVVPEDITPFALQRSVAVLKPQNIDSKYLSYLLESPKVQRYFQENAKGTAQKGIYLKALADVEIPLAPLNEQKRIADKLDTLLIRIQDCREGLDKVSQILKRFRQAVLTSATFGMLTQDWKNAEGVKVEWTEVELGDVAEEFSYGSSAKSAKEGAVPVLRMGNIQSGQLDWDDLVFTSNLGEIAKYRLDAGDVLFNRTNSPELVGKTAVFKGEREAIFAGYLIRVRCGEQLHPDFLTYCLNSPAGRDYCWRVKSDGVSQSNINAKKLARFPIRLPPIDEQCEIVDRVERLFVLADNLEAHYRAGRERLDQLIPSLLDRAYQGDLVSQDQDDQPAIELLKSVNDGTSIRQSKNKKTKKSEIKEEYRMTKKSVTTLDELVSVLNQLGGSALAERLVVESGLFDDIDRFYELLREGRNSVITVPVGANKPIRSILYED